MDQPVIDLFASRLSNQLPAFYSWKPDPNSLALNALQQTWSHKHLLCFSPIFSDTQDTKEGRVGESPVFDTNSTNLAEPDMVPSVNSFFNEKSPALTSTFKSLKEPSRGNTQVSCLDYYRQHLAKKGITEGASNLVFSSRREGTTSNYFSSWNKWHFDIF